MAAKTIWYNNLPFRRHDREIFILLPPNSNWMKHVSCVYRIKFGNKYYIGKTALLYRRMNDHRRCINKAINEFPNFNTVATKSYEKIARFLLENKYINVGYIEVLHQCENEYELWYMENKYLNDSRGDENCLNCSFYSGKPGREMKMLIQQRFYEFYRWFYNPEFDHELAEWDEITTAGKWRIKKGSDRYDKYSLMQGIVDKYGTIY